MDASFPGNLPEHPDDPRVNMILELLLESLEAVLHEARRNYAGQPLFAVEGKIRADLQIALPGVQCTAEDIRAWAAEISS